MGAQPKKLVLVVDDEADVRDLIRIVLEGASYRVVTAHDGPEALALVEEELPDLVVLDVMMPRMSGISVARQLRAGTGTHNIPILMLTARTSSTDVRDALAVGVDVHLSKPFSPDELISFVERLCTGC